MAAHGTTCTPRLAAPGAARSVVHRARRRDALVSLKDILPRGPGAPRGPLEPAAGLTPPPRTKWSVGLRHAPLDRNLPSILKAGLLASKSQGRLPAVWLRSPSCSAWAVWHPVRRHGGRIEAI